MPSRQHNGRPQGSPLQRKRRELDKLFLVPTPERGNGLVRIGLLLYQGLLARRGKIDSVRLDSSLRRKMCLEIEIRKIF